MADDRKVVHVHVEEHKGPLSSHKATVVLDDGSVGEAKGTSAGDAVGGANYKARSGCFPATARVLTPHGEQSIASFVVGDVVLSFDPVQQQLVESVVTKRRARPPCLIWEVTFVGNNRSALRATRGHTLLTARGWRRIHNLKPGDYLIGAGRDLLQIETISATMEREKVYNLVTSGKHNFIVDGVVAHNFAVLRATRTLWHRTFIDDLATYTQGTPNYVEA